jgi:Transposase DDE domain
MPASLPVYHQIYHWLDQHLDAQVDPSTRERLALLVTGLLRSQNAAPAQIAKAIKTLGLSAAKTESIERRIRRLENDSEVSAALCLHPLVRQRLAWVHAERLFLILDPTTQEDRVVLVSVALWYRGRALPLAWAVWPANTPLEGARFWQRIKTLLDEVAPLLPRGVEVVWLADRAFGTPAFTDLVTAHGWHYIVRVQDQTCCQSGTESLWQRSPAPPLRAVRALVAQPGQRAKCGGRLFKKRGWRRASVVVAWGRRHRSPLCLVSDLKPRWELLAWYRRRFPIEATFRDYKSYGWHWEQGQVTDLEHVKRLLVGMALASWVVLCAGTQAAAEFLAQRARGRRRSVPWEGKRSLFALGLQRLQELLQGSGGAPAPKLRLELSDWEAPHWQAQITCHHVRAFVFHAAATPGHSLRTV